jgi:hypothetical protein
MPTPVIDSDRVQVVLPPGPPTLTATAARELLEILLEAHTRMSKAVPDAA